jgi:hypothetical protein
MWEFIKQNPFIVGALTGSLASYLLGLMVSYLRRDKKWLGYSIASRNIVLKGHTHLSMKYDEREINRLDSHAVAIRNIGNRPLTALPVRIEAQKGSQIVEHELAAPDGAHFSIAADNGNSLIVTCDLLNPGEVATVGVTVADSQDGSVKVIARGENLRVKDISQQLETDEFLDAIAGSFWMTKLTVDLYRLFTKARRTQR